MKRSPESIQGSFGVTDVRERVLFQENQLTSQVKDGQLILAIVFTEPHWRKAAKDGVWLYYDLDQNRQIPFQRRSLVVIQDSPEKLAGAIMSASALTPPKKETILQEITQITDSLSSEAPFLLVEQRLIDLNLEWRKNLLVETPLVETEVTHKGKSLIWRGRMPKEREKRTVDLLEVKPGDTYGMIRWREDLPQRPKRMYPGYEVDASEMIERLKNSSNPPEDLRRLKMGYGVKLTDPVCKCCTRIDLEGAIIPLYTCPEHSNSKVLELAPRTNEPPVCGNTYCDNPPMEWNKSEGRFICPHCRE